MRDYGTGMHMYSTHIIVFYLHTGTLLLEISYIEDEEKEDDDGNGGGGEE